MSYICSSHAIWDRAIHWREVYIHGIKLVCQCEMIQGGSYLPLGLVTGHGKKYGRSDAGEGWCIQPDPECVYCRTS